MTEINEESAADYMSKCVPFRRNTDPDRNEDGIPILPNGEIDQQEVDHERWAYEDKQDNKKHKRK